LGIGTYLHSEKRNAGQQIYGRLEVHQFLLAGRREVIPVHGQVYSEGVVQLVEQLYEFFFLQAQSEGGLRILRSVYRDGKKSDRKQKSPQNLTPRNGRLR